MEPQSCYCHSLALVPWPFYSPPQILQILTPPSSPSPTQSASFSANVLSKLSYCQQLPPHQPPLPPTPCFLKVSPCGPSLIPPPMLQTHHSPQVLCFIINQPLQQLQSLPTGPFSSAYKPVQVSIKTKPSSHSTSDNHCPSISSYPTPFPHPPSPFHCLLLSPPFP